VLRKEALNSAHDPFLNFMAFLLIVLVDLTRLPYLNQLEDCRELLNGRVELQTSIH
jgi:hypothetical protein